MKTSDQLAPQKKPPRIKVLVDEEHDQLQQFKLNSLRLHLESSMGPRHANQAEGISYLSSPNLSTYEYDPEMLLTDGSVHVATRNQDPNDLMIADEIDEFIFDAGKFKETLFIHKPTRSLIATNLVECHDLDDHTLIQIASLGNIGLMAPGFSVPRKISVAFDDTMKARESCLRLLMKDWDCVFMAHGVHMMTGAKAHMRRALYWLLNPVAAEHLKYKVWGPEESEDAEVSTTKRKRGFEMSEYGV